MSYPCEQSLLCLEKSGLFERASLNSSFYALFSLYFICAFWNAVTAQLCVLPPLIWGRECMFCLHFTDLQTEGQSILREMFGLSDLRDLTMRAGVPCAPLCSMLFSICFLICRGHFHSLFLDNSFKFYVHHQTCQFFCSEEGLVRVTSLTLSFS